MSTKKVVLFNHKGGVSKTTTTFHIGWMLAKMGHKNNNKSFKIERYAHVSRITLLSNHKQH